MSSIDSSKIIPIMPVAPGGDGEDAETTEFLYQAHQKIYPRAVSGRFANWRWALVWITQIIFYGLPWLRWGGRQAVLFDLLARRFYIFNLVLYPQDFVYLTGLLVISAYSLFLFTAIGGRLWCGFACPQTVYTEIFLWVEHRIEGDRQRRMKLDAAPWSLEKLARKSAKQGAWLLISLWTGFTLVCYFTPATQLLREASHLGFGPWEWFWVVFYGVATYGNAGFMREQVCKYMCPYARFQSAMFDRDTLIVSYDNEIGEPRGSRSRKVDYKEKGLGTCVDCSLCVQVCPTGIDIRKGLQYECIGCGSCIDVCDSVMDKMNYPRGLIRFATENALKNHWGWREMVRHVLRPRILIYSTILLLIVGGIGTSLYLRSPFRVDVVRDRGTLARMVEGGRIENVYRLQVMNSTESVHHYHVDIVKLPNASIVSQADFELLPAGAQWFPVVVQISPEIAQQLGSGPHKVEFDVHQLASPERGEVVVKEKTTFIIPR